MTSAKIMSLLEKRYDEPSRWMLFGHVGSGGNDDRSVIDALAVNLWQTEGLYRAGFEIKVSRTDFLNELRNPAKNQWARTHCHEFWYITAKDVVADKSEIPEGCGWLLAQKTRLVTKIAARRCEDAELDPLFLASLCRAWRRHAADDLHEATVTARSRLMAEDHQIKEALAIAEGCRQFLHERGGFIARMAKGEDMYQALNDAMPEQQEARALRQVLDRLGGFQKQLLTMFYEFCRIAHVGLLETDEAGKYVMSYWSLETEELLRRAQKRIELEPPEKTAIEFMRAVVEKGKT